LTLLESTPMAKASHFYLKGLFEYLGVKVINSSKLRSIKHDSKKMKVKGRVN